MVLVNQNVIWVIVNCSISRYLVVTTNNSLLVKLNVVSVIYNIPLPILHHLTDWNVTLLNVTITINIHDDKSLCYWVVDNLLKCLNRVKLNFLSCCTTCYIRCCEDKLVLLVKIFQHCCCIESICLFVNDICAII